MSRSTAVSHNGNHTRAHARALVTDSAVQEELTALRDEVARLRSHVNKDAKELSNDGIRIARSAANVAGAAAGTVVRAARGTAQAATTRARDVVQERPLTTVAAAAGLGMVLGAGMLMFSRRR